MAYTGHELARKLLEMEDLPVYVPRFEGGHTPAVEIRFVNWSVMLPDDEIGDWISIDGDDE